MHVSLPNFLQRKHNKRQTDAPLFYKRKRAVEKQSEPILAIIYDEQQHCLGGWEKGVTKNKQYIAHKINRENKNW